jgi:hypothetical protein
VQRPEHVERAEDHQGQRALLDVELFSHRLASYGVPIRHYASEGFRSIRNGCSQGKGQEKA